MKRWRRIVFSVVSLFWGAVSLDFLYFSFRLLTGADREGNRYQIQQEGIRQLLGALLFLLWFFLIAVYLWFIRRSSVQIDLVETDPKTGQPRVKRKWFDIILQIALLLTGGILRWGYLLFWYFPNSL